MSSRRKIDINSESYDKKFSNWLAQLSAMLNTKNFYLIAGRGSAKTTDFQVNRLVEMVYDMPGAPICWVADTFTDLQANILNTVVAGLERIGFREGIHYVIDKAPPEYTEAEKAELPDWLRPHFWKPVNKIVSYKRKMIFFTGLNVTFVSLDRPASGAGNSYVHLIGDEVKYFKDEKIANLKKAVRGYRELYGDSVFYRGDTFTTDMPDTRHIGEYDWILKQGKKMNVNAIHNLAQAAFVLNECKIELLAAKERENKQEIISKARIYERWLSRCAGMRLLPDFHTFYCVASSYVNIDILTPEYVRDAMESDLGDINTAIFSLLPSIAGGDRFYCNLGEQHFYYDGTDDYWSEYFGLRDAEDCRILRYLKLDQELQCGLDFGNMNSMSIMQEDVAKNELRFLKFLDAISPESIDDLAERFLRYFEPMQKKELVMYYDRAGNNFKNSGKDIISDLKNKIEIYQRGPKKGQRTGWCVRLGSLNQGIIGQQEEYYFMQEIFSGNNPRLPRVSIDAYHCKPLKCSLEIAKTKKVTNAKGAEYITKDKSSEKLPVARLRYESTNPSDSLKYGLMTRERRNIVSKRGGGSRLVGM
ncbi:MAG: hypothetical protein LBN27_12295 [Prevotellaceae bacterium]|jgi:hypothetical protein|nr:hypothetical protein [Prevotellaceae bacterium]